MSATILLFKPRRGTKPFEDRARAVAGIAERFGARAELNRKLSSDVCLAGWGRKAGCAMDGFAAKNSSYSCTLFVHRTGSRYLLLCQDEPFPRLLHRNRWQLLAYGFEPPARAKPGLKVNRFHQLFHLDG